MKLHPLTAPKRHRESLNHGRLAADPLDVPLPEVLVAYMTVHEQLRYPRILRVNSDTRALQFKLSEMVRSGGAVLGHGPDPAAVEAREKAAARAALDQLRIGACLYAPLSGYDYSAYFVRRREEPRNERTLSVGNMQRRRAA